MTSIDDKLGKKRVLIVDDCPGDRLLIKCALEDLYSLDFAGDGLAATELIKSNEYHAVLSDLNMPKMSGLELYGWLDKHKPSLRDKFLLRSSIHQSEALISGINYLDKNSSDDYLRKRMDEIVEGK